MIKNVINRIISNYSMGDNAGAKLYIKVLQCLGCEPFIVCSPDGAVDEYYNVNNKAFNVSYFDDGGIAVASYLKTA